MTSREAAGEYNGLLFSLRFTGIDKRNLLSNRRVSKLIRDYCKTVVPVASSLSSARELLVSRSANMGFTLIVGTPLAYPN